MKKLVSILCAAALVLSLAACGAESQSGGDEAKAAVYSLESATTFTFSDSGITAQDGSYTGYEIDGTTLTIDGAGAYVVTGACADGSIQIKKGTTGVTLALNGLALTSADTAPILCGKSTEVVIVAADGSTNSLTDAAENNDDSYPDNTEAENAVIKCKDGAQMTLCGGGALTINANGKNGIKSGASTTEEGEASLTIRELTLNIEALVNDAINAEQRLKVESGNLTIAAGEDAIHCDMELNIGAEGTTGPAITVSTCGEGLEGAVLNIYSGNMDITSTDDCLNAANSDLGDYAFEMNISGGTIKAYSSGGDGFDSNGTLTITGGDISVWTASTADNQPLDADGRITISGGTVLAAGGSAGMGFSISASQPYVTFGGGRDSSLSLAGGEAFSIADESGKSVLDSTALCNAAFLFYSSPALMAEGRYSVQSTVTATAKTGEADTRFGGNGGPGGSSGQRPDGMTPPDGAPSDGQPPQSDGTTPPELPAASSN